MSENPSGQSQATPEPVADAVATRRGMIDKEAEKFVRDVLRIFGQHADADNEKFVRAIAKKVMKAMVS